MKVPEGNLTLSLLFGMSNSLSDIDNPVKPFVDILQKKYKFNDRMINRLIVFKEKVDKGGEYIDFELSESNP